MSIGLAPSIEVVVGAGEPVDGDLVPHQPCGAVEQVDRAAAGPVARTGVALTDGFGAEDWVAGQPWFWVVPSQSMGAGGTGETEPGPSVALFVAALQGTVGEEVATGRLADGRNCRRGRRPGAAAFALQVVLADGHKVEPGLRWQWFDPSVVGAQSVAGYAELGQRMELDR